MSTGYKGFVSHCYSVNMIFANSQKLADATELSTLLCIIKDQECPVPVLEGCRTVGWFLCLNTHEPSQLFNRLISIVDVLDHGNHQPALHSGSPKT